MTPKSIIITKPHLPSILEDLRDLKRLILRDETLSGAMLRDENIAKLAAKNFRATELKFEGLNAAEAKLEKSDFTDIAMFDCELVAANFAEASWRRVLVQNARSTGLQLQTSTFKDVTFDGCKLDLTNFRFAKLKNVCFTGCILDEADFYMAELENVYFRGCSLRKTEFSSAKLKRVDLRTSDVAEIAGVTSLAGAIIDSVQLVALAPLLATASNIQIRDE